MNKLVLALVAGLAVIAPALAAEDAYRIRVDGLACPFCAYGIEKKLERLPGVTGIEMDMENGVVTVHLAPGAALGEAALRKAVRDAGFTPREITGGPAPRDRRP